MLQKLQVLLNLAIFGKFACHFQPRLSSLTLLNHISPGQTLLGSASPAKKISVWHNSKHADFQTKNSSNRFSFRPYSRDSCRMTNNFHHHRGCQHVPRFLIYEIRPGSDPASTNFP